MPGEDPGRPTQGRSFKLPVVSTILPCRRFKTKSKGTLLAAKPRTKNQNKQYYKQATAALQGVVWPSPPYQKVWLVANQLLAPFNLRPNSPLFPCRFVYLRQPMASEIQPTPRQLSPLPREVELQEVQSAADRHEWLCEWNVHEPLSKGATYIRAFATIEGETPANEESLGSIYKSRFALSGPLFFRRSARIIRKRSAPQSPLSHSNSRSRNPLGTYYHSSYTPTQQQSAEIIISCPEINAVYCTTRENWKLERRRRRIFVRDFPRYNRALGYCDLQHCNSEEFGSIGWEQVIASQKDYQPSLREDRSPTPGFTTDESDLEPCSDTELFGYTTKPPSRTVRHG